MSRLSGSLVPIALVALVAPLTTLQAQRAQSRQLYKLHVFPTASSIGSVSRTGAVVGGAGGNGFVWRKSTGIVPLAPLAGWNASNAADIDNLGNVVGSSYIGSSQQATLWQAGNPIAITVPGATSSGAGSITNAGVVLGGSDQGFWVWDSLQGARLLTSLGLPSDFYAADINESSQVTGGEPYGQAWLFDVETSTFTSCGTLGGLYSSASGLNNRGHVVGWSMVPGFGYEMWPFLFTPEEGMLFLGSIDPSWMFHFQGNAADVNDDDVVVGSIQVSGNRNHAFLWDRTYGMRDLNRLVPDRGAYELERASRISNPGWITGRALNTSAGNAYVNFVLEPQ